MIEGLQPEFPDESRPIARRGQPLTFEDLARLLGLVALLFLGISLATTLKPALLLCAVSFLAAMVINPLIVRLERRGVTRGMAILLVGLVFLIIIVLAVWLFIPPFLDQLQALVQAAPETWKRIYGQFGVWIDRYPIFKSAISDRQNDMFNAAQAQVGGVARFLLRSTLGVFGSLFGGVFGLMLAIFALSDPMPIVNAYLKLAPERYRKQARRVLARMMHQVSAWARGVIINGAATGISTGVLLSLVHVQPAFVFGVLAFLGEFVPMIGSIVAAIPALFVAASMGPTSFALAMLVILFVQQVEANLLIPFVLGKQMNLHPVTILFFTLAMGSLFGLAGAILVVPAAALVKILISEFYLRPQRLNEAEFAEASRQIIAGQINPEE
jgi:predicted PurR-regulated permease PerM